MASYQACATSSAVEVELKAGVLSIPETLPNSVSVAHGKSAVTVTPVHSSSLYSAFEKELT